MRYTYPHTIDTGAGGERLTFVRLVSEPDGDRLEVEGECAPGAGPAMHVHYKQAEYVSVVSGRMAVELENGEKRELGPGEGAEFKAGVGHRFYNCGTEPLKLKGWIKPADNVEYFLTELFGTMKANGGKRPGMFEGAWLSTRYASEFGLPGLPGFVKNVIFPIVLFFGKLAGKHKKFADAPEPLR